MKDFPEELTNAAKHMQDAVNLHVIATVLGVRMDKPGFIAVRLDDGRSPTGEMYDTRADAVRFNGMNRNVFYVKIGRERMGDREALIVMQMNRQAYKNGVVFSEEHVETPHLSELMLPFIPKTLHRLGGIN